MPARHAFNLLDKLVFAHGWSADTAGIVVPQSVRETRQAVADLIARGEPVVSLTQLARALKLNKSSASRYVTKATEMGYLRNLQRKRGVPARIVLGDEIDKPAGEPVEHRARVLVDTEPVPPLMPSEETLSPIYVTYNELKDIVGVTWSRVHLRRLQKAGKFPQSFELTPKRIGWDRAEVIAWSEQRQHRIDALAEHRVTKLTEQRAEVLQQFRAGTPPPKPPQRRVGGRFASEHDEAVPPSTASQRPRPWGAGIADDRLEGAREIALFLFGCGDRKHQKRVYHLTDKHRIPHGFDGHKLIASKAKLRANWDRLTQQEVTDRLPPQAAPPGGPQDATEAP
jgi:predicted DNA-binding transcriptional regulator AlpA